MGNSKTDNQFIKPLSQGAMKFLNLINYHFSRVFYKHKIIKIAIIKSIGFLNGESFLRSHPVKSNLSSQHSSFTFQFFSKCLKQVSSWSSFLLANQHLRFNRTHPTNPKCC